MFLNHVFPTQTPAVSCLNSLPSMYSTATKFRCIFVAMSRVSYLISTLVPFVYVYLLCFELLTKSFWDSLPTYSENVNQCWCNLHNLCAKIESKKTQRKLRLNVCFVNILSFWQHFYYLVCYKVRRDLNFAILLPALAVKFSERMDLQNDIFNKRNKQLLVCILI